MQLFLYKRTTLKRTLHHTLILFFFLLSFHAFAQFKVGLVLSGGGATGLAHIGVIKALEENNIPISYVCGTSAGALVGAMYASGYSPAEMEAYVLSTQFKQMTMGEIPSGRRYLFREDEPDASMLSFPFRPDSLLKTSIPLNLVTPSFLDCEMLKIMGLPSASNNKNFDQLFVPYRCVAADVVNKKSVTFSKGDLNAAVRASMTYPFYVNPIKIDGVVYFDGGLYNNFPVNVMYHDFQPDFIIGSNVSENAKKPDVQDFMGLLENMLRTPTDYTLPCSEGIIIEPKMSVSTFDFDGAKKAIQEGYLQTLKYIDSIQKMLPDDVKAPDLTQRRALFRANILPIQISSITTDLRKKDKVNYVDASMIRSHKNEVVSLKNFENRYYRLYAAQQIDYLFPTLTLKKDSTYHLNLNVRKAKPFKLDVGGHLSSRPVNTGFLGLTYRHLGEVASFVHAESYFGKFYGSVKSEVGLDIPSVLPISASAYFVMNRWDYYRSFATFFEDIKPSFLVQNEMYYGVKIKHPILNNSKAVLDFRWFNLEDNYYQTSSFLSIDTADMTQLRGSLVSYEIVDNALNRKQFASEGHFLSAKIKYLSAEENTTPGTTSLFDTIVNKQHDWINLSVESQYYFLTQPHFHLGLHARGMFNSQSLFANYTASLLAMPNLSVLPDLETFFLKEYRSPQHVALGVNLVFPIRKAIEYRIDLYYYQPFLQLEKLSDGSVQYSKPFKGNTWVGATSLIYHSVVGPLRATLNYFPLQIQPWNFQVSFGYVLFNERAVR